MKNELYVAVSELRAALEAKNAGTEAPELHPVAAKELAGQRWISVAKKLPPVKVPVLACLEDGTVVMAKLYPSITGDEVWCRLQSNRPVETHYSFQRPMVVLWMPLPPRPTTVPPYPLDPWQKK